MRLKRLEVFGFKSFCEKTVITFQQGITAVVGPNGCGKSNIVDAILWAMGEQSAKTLRGDRMEDVLFNGSPQRKPINMAEATLTISGLKGELSSSFASYSEVEITRRLFRSGESEYLINRVPCRLKDVRDLLMDAGAGFKGHTIIEQGRIDQILQASPTDRRAIIEEAAGILKYRVRKTEALRKLEGTEQNLVRVRDIISEIRRQINGLERQAEKAKKQTEILGEIKRLELHLMGTRYRGFQKLWGETVALEQTLETEEMGKLAELATQEAHLQDRKLLLMEGNNGLARLRQDMVDAEREVHRQEGQLEILKNQAVSCSEQIDRYSREIAEGDGQVTLLQSQGDTLSDEQHRLEGDLADGRENLTRQEASFDALTGTSRQAKEDLESVRHRLFAHLGRITENKNRGISIQTRMEETARRKERIGSEQSDTAQGIGRSQERIVEEENRLQEMIHLLAQGKEDRSSLFQIIRGAEAELSALHLTLQARKEELHRKEARHHSLSEVERNLIGYQEGARSLLLSKERNPDRFTGIYGMVAHIVETQPAYEKAVEAVLGDRLQHLIVEDQAAAREAIAFLKEGSGRGTFIPLQLEGAASWTPDLSGPLAVEDGVIGPALQLVQYPESYRGVMDHLMRDVWIVSDWETACRLWSARHLVEGGPRETWVTLDGEVLDASGVVTGGDTQGSLPNLMPKRRELKTLDKEITRLREEVAGLEEKALIKAREIDSLKGQWEEKDGQERSLELQCAHKEKDLQVLRDEAARLRQHLQTLSIETEEADRFLAELGRALEEIHLVLQSVEEERETTDREIARLQEVQQVTAGQWEAAQQEILGLKTGLATLQEKYQSGAQRLSEISRRREGLMQTLHERREEVFRLSRKREGFGEEETAIREGLETRRERETALRGEFAAQEQLQREMEEGIRSIEIQVRSLRSALDPLRTQKGQCEVKKAELRLEMDHIQEYLRAAYSLSMEECLDPVLTDDTIPPAEGENETDIDARNRELTVWKERLHRLGPVNPAAIEEFQELQTRYDFLSKQEADLTEACDTLQKTIQRINETTRDLFMETFQILNENFQKVFQTLFREGTATLLLTDPGRVLDSGIEITAQPSGKRVSHLSLLSGGEKALTAIALLFASFLVRPTPFCVLDEIDAPLDESNTVRFLETLRSMTDRSQFIAITHNKRTMEAADMLYGITMEEPGISKVLSVNLTREPAVEKETEIAAA